MSETKHTPVFHGPFEYVPGTENHGPYVTNAVGNTICDCYVMIDSGGRFPTPLRPLNHCGEMAEDYACLFGASFDLLEAAKEVLSSMESTGEYVGGYNQLRAAVAKAEGRS